MAQEEDGRGREQLRSAVSNNFLTRQKESATAETRETEGGSLVLWMFSSGAAEDGHELLPNNTPTPPQTQTLTPRTRTLNHFEAYFGL